jgi:hypothetical protein
MRDMEPTRTAPAGLYAQILGSHWNDLDESMRRLHDTGASFCARGTFRVCRGNSRLVRFLATLGRLPQAVEAAEMRLLVARLEHIEEWRRSFGRQPLISTQWRDSKGWMVERMGPTETRFELKVVDGALLYSSNGAAIRLGPLRIPVPRWFAPRVTASEKPTGEPDRVAVFVEVQLPLLGRLISYEGIVSRTAADV